MREWILGWNLFSPQIRQQILTMTVMFLCGSQIGFFRWLHGMTVKRWKTRPVTAWILEVWFWVFSGFCAAEYFYYCSYGEVTVHGTVSMFLGFCFWKKCRQNLTDWGIIKRSETSGESVGEKIHGKNETKPFLQKRKRKQCHRH